MNKKITLKQSEAWCKCGHQRWEHSDDMEDSGKVLKEATELCLHNNCKCDGFERRLNNNINRLTPKK